MWIPKGVALIRGRDLFEARRLLEEIRYVLLKLNRNIAFVSNLLLAYFIVYQFLAQVLFLLDDTWSWK